MHKYTTHKTETTKEKLFRVATRMISQKGFKNTTMRAIASEAGVALGTTYYYFESKESFVYEYYKQSHDEHIKALGNFLENEGAFEKRLQKVLTTKIEVAQPYKKMARALYQIAANPQSSLSPWSKESQQLKLKSLKIFEDVVKGCQEKIHPKLKKILPNYLWLYQMGIILF